jgi:hypothetical protein
MVALLFELVEVAFFILHEPLENLLGARSVLGGL